MRRQYIAGYSSKVSNFTVRCVGTWLCSLRIDRGLAGVGAGSTHQMRNFG
jgi:hypothetical protein